MRLVDPVCPVDICMCVCVYYLPLQGDSPVPRGGGRAALLLPLASHSPAHALGPYATSCLYLSGHPVVIHVPVRRTVDCIFCEDLCAGDEKNIERPKCSTQFVVATERRFSDFQISPIYMNQSDCGHGEKFQPGQPLAVALEWRRCGLWLFCQQPPFARNANALCTGTARPCPCRVPPNAEPR
jgi:hypothetical protein